MTRTEKFFTIAAALRYAQRTYNSRSYKYRDDYEAHKDELNALKEDKKALEKMLDDEIEDCIDRLPKDDMDILDNPVPAKVFANLLSFRKWCSEHPKK